MVYTVVLQYLYVFTLITFECHILDTTIERNLLMETAYRDLKSYCEERNFKFEASSGFESTSTRPCQFKKLGRGSTCTLSFRKLEKGQRVKGR